MKITTLILVGTLAFVSETAFSKDAAVTRNGPGRWKPLLGDLLRANRSGPTEACLQRLLAFRPSCPELADALQNISYDRLERGAFHSFTLDCCDGKLRPWLLYVPTGYFPVRASLLLVVLHGGVSGESVTPDTLRKWAEEDPFFKIAQGQNWLMLFPFAQDGATWWDEVGIDNIRWQIRLVKAMANVDDDRVWLAGFSDGAGGALTMAMLTPDDFAAVIAANGHPALGNIEGDLPLRLPALSNTPCYVLHSNSDEFYPVKKMRPLMEMAQKAGAEVLWREKAGSHQFPDRVFEIPRMTAFLRRHPRDPFPGRIVFETEQPKWGKCRWLSIEQITDEPAAQWYEDYNPIVRHEEANFHFIEDQLYKGEGVRARRVFPMSLCSALGMQTGDILIAFEGKPVKASADLQAAKQALKAGEIVELRVIREGKTQSLSGRLPDPSLNYVFDRSSPSAMVRALAMGNRISIDTSRVGKLRIFIHPDMFNLDQPIEVVVNGRGMFRSIVSADPAYMLRGFLAQRDRQMLFVNEIVLDDIR